MVSLVQICVSTCTRVLLALEVYSFTQEKLRMTGSVKLSKELSNIMRYINVKGRHGQVLPNAMD